MNQQAEDKAFLLPTPKFGMYHKINDRAKRGTWWISGFRNDSDHFEFKEDL